MYTLQYVIMSDPWPPKLDSIVLEDNWNVEMREAAAACPEFGEWWEERIRKNGFSETERVNKGSTECFVSGCKIITPIEVELTKQTGCFAPSVSELKKQFVEAKEKEFVDARQRLRELRWATEDSKRVAALDAATAKSLKFETRLKELYEQIPRLDEKQVRRKIAAEFGFPTFCQTTDNRLLQQHQAELEYIARLRVGLQKLAHKYGAPIATEMPSSPSGPPSSASSFEQDVR